MSVITPPPLRVLEQKLPTLLQWLMQVYRICFSVQESGTTANRPTANLWVGRQYFDTTLGIPIFLKTVSTSDWVDAAGASV